MQSGIWETHTQKKNSHKFTSKRTAQIPSPTHNTATRWPINCMEWRVCLPFFIGVIWDPLTNWNWEKAFEMEARSPVNLWHSSWYEVGGKKRQTPMSNATPTLLLPSASQKKLGARKRGSKTEGTVELGRPKREIFTARQWGGGWFSEERKCLEGGLLTPPTTARCDTLTKTRPAL